MDLMKKMEKNKKVMDRVNILEKEAVEIFSEDYPDLNRYNEKIKEIEEEQKNYDYDEI